MYAQIQTSKFGGELVSFKLNGEEKMHQGQDCIDEKGKVYWKRISPVLFPIVGKLKKNQTLINGKICEILQNGFARDMEFEPVTKLENFHSYLLKDNKKTFDRFPYKFSLYITYRQYENQLTTIYKVINNGENNMPFGIGGQPAFKIDPRELEAGNYYLEFEEEESKIHFLYLMDGLVGTGYSKNYIDSTKKIIKLNKDMFLNNTIIIKGLTSHKVSLKNSRTKKTLLIMDYEGFPYLALWTKPNAPFISIAPWQTIPDNFNCSGIFKEKPDTIILKPNQEYTCRYTVEFFN